jgi:hypothetical protein
MESFKVMSVTNVEEERKSKFGVNLSNEIGSSVEKREEEIKNQVHQQKLKDNENKHEISNNIYAFFKSITTKYILYIILITYLIIFSISNIDSFLKNDIFPKSEWGKLFFAWIKSLRIILEYILTYSGGLITQHIIYQKYNKNPKLTP